MKIAIYTRKSKFTGKGESIGNQIQLCRELEVGQADEVILNDSEDEVKATKVTALTNGITPIITDLHRLNTSGNNAKSLARF